VEEKNQRVAKPLKTTIKAIRTGGAGVEEAGPGGSIGILTGLDPSLVKSDSLTGSVVGLPGKLPPVLHEMKLKVTLLERVVGTKEDLAVEPIKVQEILMLNVNASATVGVVYDLKKNEVSCRLKLPVCAEKGSRVTISRRVGNRFRLIGYGFIE
jgi:translation initiation factor 2 subunit 3